MAKLGDIPAWNNRSRAFADNFGAGDSPPEAARKAGYAESSAKNARTRLLYPLIRSKGLTVLRRFEKAGMSKSDCLRLFAKAAGYPLPVAGNDIVQALAEAGLTVHEVAEYIIEGLRATRTKTYKMRDEKGNQIIHKEPLEDNLLRGKVLDIVMKAFLASAPQKIQVSGGLIHGHVQIPTSYLQQLREDDKKFELEMMRLENAEVIETESKPAPAGAG